ncbi:hypothetical protein [Microbacterium lacticum]|uniref:Gram-positive cocci surface proteins LPxTG domain-containing protein n=1 Tax=Microbacterium lacticum TaxID=33885 RepID=A0A4Y3UJX0_9MICO|nr:hypothetical protein [Microbacterium lacticum]TQM95160.1 hypothetical protein FHX68_2505 [Microbacterium lacticum]GEB94603.1 hypothetical protein MLA01_08220 [Microbacterium lacticum]GGN20359.1 hypothetical protein GCM10009724_13100 [Microbacterium lacticum]
MFHRLHLRPGMPLAATAVAAVLIFAPVAAFAEDAVTVFAGADADADAAPAPAAAPVAPAAAPVAPAALPAPGDPCAPAVCIDNGTVLLAVNPTGELNTRDGTGSAAGPGDAGLEYLPTGNDSTSPGCLCEGWGVGDPASGVWGGANLAELGPGGRHLELESFDHTASTASSVVRVLDGGGSPFLRVTHEYTFVFAFGKVGGAPIFGPVPTEEQPAPAAPVAAPAAPVVVAAAAEAAAVEAPAAQLAVTGGDASATPLLLAAGVFALLAGAGAVAASGMRRRH